MSITVAFVGGPMDGEIRVMPGGQDTIVFKTFDPKSAYHAKATELHMNYGEVVYVLREGPDGVPRYYLKGLRP
jgi:hypothetical protein